MYNDYDFERSIGIAAATQMCLTGLRTKPANLTQQLCNQKDTLKMC